MNKQKQIEELKKILCTPCAELVEEHDKTKNLPAIYAETLYNAGYRKADEVRKETAEKILNELIDSSNKITFFDCRMALGLDKLAKQYGVEVEE